MGQQGFLLLGGGPVQALLEGVLPHHVPGDVRDGISFENLLHGSVPPICRMARRAFGKGTVQGRRVRFLSVLQGKERPARPSFPVGVPSSSLCGCTGTASRVHSFHLACVKKYLSYRPEALFSKKGQKKATAFRLPQRRWPKNPAGNPLRAQAPAAVRCPSFWECSVTLTVLHSWRLLCRKNKTPVCPVNIRELHASCTFV